MVMGVALHLYPRKELGEATMRDLANSTDYKFRNLAKMGLAAIYGDKYDESVAGFDQPFMDKFYVKAKDLANHINDKYGRPDFVGDGQGYLKSKFSASKGVMYLGGFWHGGHGDHIDLWDGSKLNVTGTPGDSISEIVASKVIWFWLVQ
jgi:hypothetical protein